MDDYDAWKSGWYDDEPPHYCSECDKLEEKIRQMKADYEELDWNYDKDIAEYRAAEIEYKKLLDMLYDREKFNKGNVEDCLDQLCKFFQLPIKNTELMIDKTKKPMPANVEDWLAYNREFLQQA